MLTGRGIIATNHVDKQGEFIGAEALERLVTDIRERVIPINFEHDELNPPIGRIVSARLVRIDDEHVGVEAEFEFWESAEDVAIHMKDQREIRTRSEDWPLFGVAYDYAFLEGHLKSVLDDISELVGGESATQYTIKKSSDIVAALVIVAGFVGTQIASGFLKKIGDDLYAALKAKLKKHAVAPASLREQLGSGSQQEPSAAAPRVVFRAQVGTASAMAEVEVVLENPTDDSIERLFDRGFEDIDKLVKSALEADPTTRRVVLCWSVTGADLRYSVNSKGIPTPLELAEAQDIDGKDSSVGE